ncbi:SCO-spondin-like [Gigantopelta aegis]|uniref:SCO-spondin-like n=1 Tax=Gigantopelta aegis TaxID=1735272 RepID=UPI001B88D153|nr:SCO-spondin-like [Gigantopelta aegis]
MGTMHRSITPIISIFLWILISTEWTLAQQSNLCPVTKNVKVGPEKDQCDRDTQKRRYRDQWVMDYNATEAANNGMDAFDIFSNPTADNVCYYFKFEDKTQLECCPGWENPDCKIPVCVHNCVKGNCSAPNTCTCDPGYGGYQCDEKAGEKYCYTGNACNGEKAPINVGSVGACCDWSGLSFGNAIDGNCELCEEVNVTTIKRDDLEYVTCVHSGESSFRTFDGVRYTYKTACKVTMLDTANIKITSKTDCDPLDTCKCTQEVVIAMKHGVESVSYVYKNGFLDGKVPTNDLQKLGDISFQKKNDLVHVNTGSGFRLRIDPDGFLTISIDKDKVKDMTLKGMCGNADLDVTDEIKLASNQFEANRYGSLFTDKSDCGALLPPCSEGDLKEATNVCSYVKSRMFKACHLLVPYKTFEETCQKAYCAAADDKKQSARCNAIQNYATECSLQNVVIAWRSKNLCPKTCLGENRMYTQCASPCQAKCGWFYTMHKDECNACFPGCTCAPGYMEDHNGNCVDASNCTCKARDGRLIKVGEKFTLKTPCPQTCTCTEGGKVKCDEATMCRGTCSVMASGYLTTFDSNVLRIDSNAMECKFSLMNFNNGQLDVTLITAKVNGAIRIEGIEIVANGVLMVMKNVGKTNTMVFEYDRSQPKLPFVSKKGDIYVNRITDIWMKFSTPYVQILVSSMGSVRIDGDTGSMSSKVSGLCGNFDENPENDFQTATGGNPSEAEFLLLKSKDEKCGEANKDTQKNEKCDPLKDILLNKCKNLDQTKTQRILEGCMTSKTDQQVCAVLADLQLECGLSLDSDELKDILNCVQECDSGLEYNPCRKDCRRSCSDLSMQNSTTCDTDTCFQGCGCPSGQYMHKDACTDLDKCPCYKGTTEILAGQTLTVDCKSCKCKNGLLSCEASECEDVVCGLNQFKSVEKPATCRKRCPKPFKTNMTCAEADGMYSRVCYCVDGTVENHDFECIQPNSCPCFTNDQWHAHGKELRDSCKVRKCNNGVWDVKEDNNCKTTCRVSGTSPIFQTFDGKLYEISEICDGGSDGNMLVTGEDLEITLTSVMCTTMNRACSYIIKINIEGKITVTITKGSGISVKYQGKTKNFPAGSRLMYMGYYISQDYVSIFQGKGLSVYYDGGQNVRVELDRRFRNKVAGMCGNNNGKTGDDFRDANGQVLTSEVQLYNAFRDESCPAITNVATNDSCTVNAERKKWAVHSCNIIKEGSIFARCRKALIGPDVDDMYSHCLQEACGCDKGGDCECLCTAISNFADLCNSKGFPVQWRHRRLCPMQCDYGSQYRACGSTCQPTCGSIEQNSDCLSSTCIEGCFCPEDMVVADSDGPEIKCIPKAECPCVVDGAIYLKGQYFTRDCMNCSCSSGRVECTGTNCTASCDESVKYRCIRGGRCIPKKNRCDDVVDCPGGDDEMGCGSCSNFTCANGKCIHESKVCDQANDCGDNSDESDAICKLCAGNVFICSNTKRLQCVMRNFVCDGVADCRDGSDEANCTVCPKDKIHCGKKICLDKNTTCDNHLDCDDGSDEMGCTTPPATTPVQCDDVMVESKYVLLPGLKEQEEDLLTNGEMTLIPDGQYAIFTIKLLAKEGTPTVLKSLKFTSTGKLERITTTTPIAQLPFSKESSVDGFQKYSVEEYAEFTEIQFMLTPSTEGGKVVVKELSIKACFEPGTTPVPTTTTTETTTTTTTTSTTTAPPTTTTPGSTTTPAGSTTTPAGSTTTPTESTTTPPGTTTPTCATIMCTSKETGQPICVPADKLCDKKPDCEDGEDERPTVCATTTTPGSTTSPSGSTTTPVGSTTTPPGTTTPTCATIICTSKETGQPICVPADKLCDKKPDCEGEEDERSTVCATTTTPGTTAPGTTTPPTTTPKECEDGLTCRSLTGVMICVQPTSFCDGKQDCENNEDETMKECTTTTPKTTVTVPTTGPGSTTPTVTSPVPKSTTPGTTPLTTTGTTTTPGTTKPPSTTGPTVPSTTTPATTTQGPTTTPKRK